MDHVERILNSLISTQVGLATTLRNVLRAFVDGHESGDALEARVAKDLDEEGLLSKPFGWSLARLCGRVYSEQAADFVGRAAAAPRRARRAAAHRYNYASAFADVLKRNVAFERAANIAKALAEGNPFERPPDPDTRRVVVSYARTGEWATIGLRPGMTADAFFATARLPRGRARACAPGRRSR